MLDNWMELSDCQRALKEPKDDRFARVAYQKLRWLCLAKMSIEKNFKVRWVLDLIPKEYSDDARQAIVEFFEVFVLRDGDPSGYNLKIQRGISSMASIERDYIKEKSCENLKPIYHGARIALAFSIAELDLGTDELVEAMPCECTDEAIESLVGVWYYVKHMSGD